MYKLWVEESFTNNHNIQQSSKKVHSRYWGMMDDRIRTVKGIFHFHRDFVGVLVVRFANPIFTKYVCCAYD
jgi:hypothetical protein